MAHLDRRRRLLLAGGATVLLALGLLGSPAGAQEDPSGTYEGTLVYDQQRGPRPPDDGGPPIEDDLPPQGITTTTDRSATLDCSGSTCIVTIEGMPLKNASVTLNGGSGTSEFDDTTSVPFGECDYSGEIPPWTLTVEVSGDQVTIVEDRPGYLVEGTTPTGGTCRQFGGSSTKTFTGTRAGGPVDDQEAPGAASSDAVDGQPPASSRIVSVGGRSVEPELAVEMSPRQVASVEAVAAGDRSLVPASLATPSEAFDGGSRTVVNVVLAGLAVLLLVFPSQLFNSTWSTHHRRVEAGFARLLPARMRRGAAAGEGSRSRVGVYVATVVAGAVIAGFLDPGFGLDAPSATLVVGALAAIAVGSLVSGLGAVRYRKVRRLPAETFVKAVPSGLAIAVVCVLISRAIGFRPGYLFGLVGGLAFVAAVDASEEGRAELVATAVALVAAFVGWVAAGPVGSWANDGDPSVLVQTLDSITASLFIGGIEGTLLGLVPLLLLPGHTLFSWRRWVWAATTFVVAFLFFQVLLRPEAGYLGTSATTSTVVTCSLFVAFGLASVLFWGYFRWRPDPP